ncbi:MAG: hypothetical protein JWN25_2993 [Verrucomicrobiales bacterium]|nr:hypothetical protein [Verrucomicrobiales bacterium]
MVEERFWRMEKLGAVKGGEIVRESLGVATHSVSFAMFAQNDDLRRWLRFAIIRS